MSQFPNKAVWIGKGKDWEKITRIFLEEIEIDAVVPIISHIL